MPTVDHPLPHRVGPDQIAAELQRDLHKALTRYTDRINAYLEAGDVSGLDVTITIETATHTDNAASPHPRVDRVFLTACRVNQSLTHG